KKRTLNPIPLHPMKSFPIKSVLFVLFTVFILPLLGWESPDLWQIAVQEQGRKKPLTTLTQESLMTLSGRSSYTRLSDGHKFTAQEVILGIWFDPEPWKKEPLILVGYRPLIESLGLDPHDSRFPYEILLTNSIYNQKLKEVRDLRMRKSNPQLDRVQKEIESISLKLTLFENLSLGRTFEIVPHPNEKAGRWTSIERSEELYGSEIAQKLAGHYEKMKTAYLQNDQELFSTSVRDFSAELRSLSPSVYPTLAALERESNYLQLHPFRKAWICYAIALLILLLTVRWNESIGYKLGWLVVLFGFGFQIYGFVTRTLISGRPPVTNMYETIIWCAFGVVLFALILEAIYRKRQFLLAACPVAVISLILADTQSSIFNSAIHPLVPVLRNNFWLTVHVLTITLSYAAFALSLALSHMAFWKIAFRHQKKESDLLFFYNYRALQIGVFLIATGTMLGAVWANYSWGRFWDWDPKETWALIVFLSYLILLHGKLAGWWKDLGVAVGSILAFQCVLMAWYGVNFVLGVGLHSYGFGVGGFGYVAGYVGLEIAFIAFGLMRHRMHLPLEEKSGS
ncbi:MAG: cytochrome c biogenesis protein CcsA, partial [Verrucomicrobiota bacterium]